MRKEVCSAVLLLVLIAVLLPASSCRNESTGPLKKVAGGKVEGFLKEGIEVYMGIPFASPPVGDLRWQPPQPVKAWEGIRNCTTPPASAMQAKPVPFMMWSAEFMAPQEPLSEDCLYLNIWTPAKGKNEKLPVMVWIHGGGFTGGSGTVPLYDGTEMAKKGVVFVTINYRLGVFGFLAHEWLSDESDRKVSGNYGILDQIEALNWISGNIVNFGGDPGNVTIAGQSAGSFSVNALMVSPLAKKLFHRAIGQSGGMFSGEGLVNDLETAENQGIRFAEAAGAKSLEELRKMPADSLIKIPGRWGITIDSAVVLSPFEAFQRGIHNDVPLITGWNADDGFMMGKPLGSTEYIKSVKERYRDNAEEYLEIFPGSDDAVAAQSQKIQSQMFFSLSNYRWASNQVSNGKNKVWLYYFSRVPPGEPDYGSFHSAEFGYCLSTLKLWNRPFTEIDFTLSDMMSAYWVNFAKKGDPNGEGLPEWTSYTSESKKTMEFSDKPEMKEVPFLKQIEYMDQHLK